MVFHIILSSSTAILGNMIRRNKEKRKMKKKGRMLQNMVSVGVFDTPAKTYTLRPTGGMIKAISVNTVKYTLLK